MSAAWKTKEITKPKLEDIEPYIAQAKHVFFQYSSKESTPSYQVGQLIEEAFWECDIRASIEVLSSRGVLPSSQVRVVQKPLSFLQNIPIIPATLAEEAQDFVGRLYARGLVTDLSVSDVKKELEAQALAENQTIDFLQWLCSQAMANALDHPTVQSLLNSTIGTVEEEQDKSKMVVMSEIKYFLSGNRIIPTMPVPESTIPHKLSRSLNARALERLGWEDLEMVHWLRWLIEGALRQQLPAEHSMLKSSEFSSTVLHTVSKHWDQLSSSARASIVGLLCNQPIMPTKFGLHKPSDAYFANVKIFEDLPTVTTGRQIKDKVLLAMGVRKTIELNVVFERLMTKSADEDGSTKWSFKDLVQYLIEVETDIPAKDIQRLRTAAICPWEIAKDKGTAAGPLMAINQLYMPKDIHRKMKLPVLYWPGMLSPGGPEARFLRNLGLRQHPSAHELFEIMVRESRRNDAEAYTLALQYFLENYELNGYSSAPKANYSTLAVLPVEGAKFPKLYSPGGCFSNSRSAVLGYPVLQASLQPHAFKFGVQADPMMTACVQTVVSNPPVSLDDATTAFAYFASRLAEISDKLADQLSFARIVPIMPRDGSGTIRMTSPRMCLLGDSSAYGNILDFVDFGQAGNSFLLKCHAKHEPTSIELAILLKNDASHVFRTIGESRYIELLGRLAENQATLRHDKTLWKQLKETPFLIAYRDIANTSDQKQSLLEELDAMEDEKIQRELTLRKASEIIVEDSYREYVIYRYQLYVAPQEQLLEKFYLALGVPNLRSILNFDQRIGSIRKDQSPAIALRKLLIERARLFLHEHTQDVLHDAKWLDKILNVIVADSLKMTLTLQGYRAPPYHENKTALLLQDRKEINLYVASRPDMYEVSACIVPLLLARPKQHDVIALESVLSSDLRRLRHKGYNVDRILKKQEVEIKLAEQNRRAQEAAKRKELESAKLAEEAARAAQAERERQVLSPTPAEGAPPPAYEAGDNQLALPEKRIMPGGFEPESPPPQQRGKSRGSQQLFTQLQDSMRRMGNSIRGQQSSSADTGVDESRLLQAGPSGTIDEPTPPTDAIGSDRNVSNNLTNAIKASRAHSSNTLFSPPQQTNVEQAQAGSYCDTTVATDLVGAGSTTAGIRFFLARKFHPDQAQAIVHEHRERLGTFSLLLLKLASIFGLPADNMHIYHDPGSKSIAFNQSGSLFFNYHYFASLHAGSFDNSRDKKIDAAAYWFITICHELAHNLVKEHSAAHSFYTESFASQYFARAVQIVLSY